MYLLQQQVNQLKKIRLEEIGINSVVIKLIGVKRILNYLMVFHPVFSPKFLREMQSFQGPLQDFKTMTADILIIPLQEDQTDQTVNTGVSQSTLAPPIICRQESQQEFTLYNPADLRNIKSYDSKEPRHHDVNMICWISQLMTRRYKFIGAMSQL